MENRITRILPKVPVVLATALLAQRCIHAVLAKLGHPGATLDDSYIHFQYARAIAEGHPFRYQAGEPITTGATSVIWPAILAPFYALGFHDDAIMWPAWAFAFAAQGMLAWEIYQLTFPLTTKPIAIASALMALTFAGFAWCSSSGMEVMPFAWAMARATRLSCEWSERPDLRTENALRWLIVMAWLAALFRPEGAVTATLVGVTIALFPQRLDVRSRAWGLAAFAGAAVTPLLLLLLTGSARSNTTVVKLMVGNPYFQGRFLLDSFVGNARSLVRTILNGEVWSAEFLPTGAAPIAILSLFALPMAGIQSRKTWRGILVLALALGMFIPCLYVTFLWNRLRYLWPFASGFFVGVGCLAHVTAEFVGSVWPKAKSLAPIFVGACAGALAVRLDWTIDDVANSARGIDQQHVKIGRWAKANLPESARIGVNDTGAIAYFGDRHTFDIVGLTSDGEAKYWVAGAASRVEHYERLLVSSPSRLPTHFIVYPEWMGTEAMFGQYLYDATVTDSTILGGQSMRAYVADYSLLGTGEMPNASAHVIDSLDVADLESESAHQYELLGAHDNEQSVVQSFAESGATILDGGRAYRHADRFLIDFGKTKSRLVLRVGKTKTTVFGHAVQLDVLVNGTSIGTADVDNDEWQQITLDVPESTTGSSRVDIQSRNGEIFTAFHYWSIAAD